MFMVIVFILNYLGSVTSLELINDSQIKLCLSTLNGWINLLWRPGLMRFFCHKKVILGDT